jgi:serine/threonine protein kinase
MLEPGTVVLGKYRIERVLGRGGMGVVARAHHLRLDQPVAIKYLLPDVLEQEMVVPRFLREAQAAVRLKSEHVSRVYDVGQLDDGVPYMVMEYLEGTDLRRYLREHGPVAAGLAVDLMLQACEALAEAHAHGIVHRDVKTSNFFLTRSSDGLPMLKVLDFGVSKTLVEPDQGDTNSQVLMGTPSYMSPEQMQSSKYVDARTDIWGMGVVLYELLSGRRPFKAESFPQLCILVATEPAPPLEVAVPTGLEWVIARCLEKDPMLRFDSMAELAASLAPYAASPVQGARSTERTARVLGLRESQESLGGSRDSGPGLRDSQTTLGTSSGERIGPRRMASAAMTMSLPALSGAGAPGSGPVPAPLTGPDSGTNTGRRRLRLGVTAGLGLVAVLVVIGILAARGTQGAGPGLQPAATGAPAAVPPVHVGAPVSAAAEVAGPAAAGEQARASQAAPGDAPAAAAEDAPEATATGERPARRQRAAVRDMARDRTQRRQTGARAGESDDDEIFGSRQ